MKSKTIFSLACVLFSISAYAQTWISGSGLVYTNPTSTRVGIGITNPSERVHINGGALKIGNTTNASDRAVNLLKFGDGSFVQIGEWEADDMLSFKANRYNFTNGNVGIGRTPSHKLDVNGVVRSTGYIGDYLDLNPNDNFTYDNQSTGHYSLNWRTDSWFSDGPTLWLASYGGMKFFTAGNARLSITAIGNVGIGTIFPGAKLDVIGTIRAHEVKVCLNQGCDFVFEPDYKLMPLHELETFVTTNRHLPEVAPAAVMESEGINLSEMNAMLLQKVEELTLYVIELNKEVQAL